MLVNSLSCKKGDVWGTFFLRKSSWTFCLGRTGEKLWSQEFNRLRQLRRMLEFSQKCGGAISKSASPFEEYLEIPKCLDNTSIGTRKG